MTEKSPDTKQKKLFFQFVKFCIIGVSNTLVNLAVYYLVILIDRELYLAAYMLAWLVSVLNAFLWNNRFVFTDRKGGWQNAVIKLVRTYISYGATLLLSTVLLHFEVEVCRISEFAAPVINVVVMTPINFVINKYWTFARREKNRDGAQDQT